MSVTEKTLAGTIDMTPSWSAVLPIYLETYESPANMTRRREALEELQRMAKIADLYTKSQKARERLAVWVNQGGPNDVSQWSEIEDDLRVVLGGEG